MCAPRLREDAPPSRKISRPHPPGFEPLFGRREIARNRIDQSLARIAQNDFAAISRGRRKSEEKRRSVRFSTSWFVNRQNLQTCDRGSENGARWHDRGASSVSLPFETPAVGKLKLGGCPVSRAIFPALARRHPRVNMSALSMRSAVATGIVAKPAARDVRARAGLKVFARMTKDRVNLKKDSKWRSDIDIYPVRAGARIDERRARGPRARDALPTRARTFPASFAPRRPARGEPPSVSFLPTQLRRRQLARQIRARYLRPALTKRLSPSRFLASQEWGEFPSSERISPITSLTYDEYKNNVSTEIIHGRFAMLGVTGAWAQENLTGILVPWLARSAPSTTAPSPTSTTPSPSYDGALLGIIFLEILLMGGAEGYRTGLLENPFDDVVAGSVFPGGRFDPLNFSEGKEANFFGEDLDTLKIKELKHCRLAMLAWLGILAQSVSTNPEGAGPDAIGPVANWSAHVADVVHCNVVDRSGCVF